MSKDSISKASDPEMADTKTTPAPPYADNGSSQDAVFGDITETGPNYRSLGWKGTIGLMMKTQIGLGILSIPGTFHTLGLIPGLICLLCVAFVTSWSNYIVGVFKLRHMEVYGIDDAGHLMFGRIGGEILGAAYALYFIFATGSAILGVSIGLNAVSNHGACTAVFVIVAAIFGFMFSSIRTFAKLTSIAWIGLFCIVTSVIIVTISVGIQDRPAAAPQDGSWASDYKLVNNPTFTEGVSAVSSMVFSYGAAPAFFALVAEMRDPRQYTRSLVWCQTAVTVIYATIGIVVYYFCGSFVASPALGSAGPLIKKIAYGIALPGLLVTTVLLSHLPAKYVFVRVLRGSQHLTANTFTHWATWLGCTFGSSLIAYLIASGIPIFGHLVGLIGALLSTTLCFQPMGCMWLYDNWNVGKTDKSVRWMVGVGWSIFVIVIGCFLTVGGTYGAVVAIVNALSAEGGSRPWGCADNSNTV